MKNNRVIKILQKKSPALNEQTTWFVRNNIVYRCFLKTNFYTIIYIIKKAIFDFVNRLPPYRSPYWVAKFFWIFLFGWQKCCFGWQNRPFLPPVGGKPLAFFCQFFWNKRRKMKKPLSMKNHQKRLKMASREGFEPPAYCLGGSRSILLSYRDLYLIW